MGIEPTLAAWEAAVLPLNYTRVRRSLDRAKPACNTIPRIAARVGETGGGGLWKYTNSPRAFVNIYPI